MNLKSAIGIIEPMESDSEILEFLRKTEYDLSACIIGIMMLKEQHILESLMDELYYRHQSLFKLALKRLIELKPVLSEEFVKSKCLQHSAELDLKQN